MVDLCPLTRIIPGNYRLVISALLEKNSYKIENPVPLIERKLIKMDLQSRKIEFVKEFLKIQSEEAITRLEKLLRKERKTSDMREFKPMTEEQLNERIELSESDFKNNRFKSSSELLAKFE